jgi:hypothetical protein
MSCNQVLIHLSPGYTLFPNNSLGIVLCHHTPHPKETGCQKQALRKKRKTVNTDNFDDEPEPLIPTNDGAYPATYNNQQSSA